jgi:nicotinate-nucleotide adenylyltransferase
MRCSIFAAAARPGFAPYKEKVTRALARQGLTRLVWVDTPEIDISSTQIRQRVRAGQAIGDLVPQAVADYIRQRELYQG